MNSVSENRRNASLYPNELGEAKDDGFGDNYKQKYESLKKIADEQNKNIVRNLNLLNSQFGLLSKFNQGNNLQRKRRILEPNQQAEVCLREQSGHDN